MISPYIFFLTALRLTLLLEYLLFCCKRYDPILHPRPILNAAFKSWDNFSGLWYIIAVSRVLFEILFFWILKFNSASTANGTLSLNRYPFIDGMISIDQGYQETSGGDIAFPVEGPLESTRALIFGPYGTQAGQEYIKGGFTPTERIDREERDSSSPFSRFIDNLK